MLEEIAALQAKNEQSQDRVIELARQGKHAEALALGIKEVRPISRALDDKAERFRERQLKLKTEGRAELAATVNLFMLTMAIVSAFAIIAGLTIGFYLSRAITRQLGKVSLNSRPRRPKFSPPRRRWLRVRRRRRAR